MIEMLFSFVKNDQIHIFRIYLNQLILTRFSFSQDLSFVLFHTSSTYSTLSTVFLSGFSAERMSFFSQRVLLQ